MGSNSTCQKLIRATVDTHPQAWHKRVYKATDKVGPYPRVRAVSDCASRVLSGSHPVGWTGSTRLRVRKEEQSIIGATWGGDLCLGVQVRMHTWSMRSVHCKCWRWSCSAVRQLTYLGYGLLVGHLMYQIWGSKMWKENKGRWSI